MKSLHLYPERLQALSDHAERLIQTQQFAGIAWQLEHHGTIVTHGSIGYVDHARVKPVSTDTLYRLYSMTKPIVSVRCLQLIETGQLHLDDPVSKWIPAFASQQVLTGGGELQALHRSMTLEDLLTHRSGLSYDFLPECVVADGYRRAGLAADGGLSLENLVGILAEHPLAFQPGSRWYYGYSTDVLAHVIERVCDQPLDQCLQQALFKPLGMIDTGFQVSEDQHHRVADMFGQRELGEVDNGSRTANELRPMNVQNSYPLSADGNFRRGGIGLYSTIPDYQAFMGLLTHGCAPDGNPLLSAPMLDLLWHNRLSAQQMPIAIGGKPYPGYGWGLTGRVMSDPSQSTTLSGVGEGGWAGAASTYFWVDRQRQFSGIIMSQYLGSAVPLGQDMQSIAYGALCHRPTSPD